MALTERTEIDRIEVVASWNIQVRQATIIERDGEFVSKTFHRWLLTPDQDPPFAFAQVIQEENTVLVYLALML